jgi:GNAT superfamily N-acetyltransferase
MKELTPEKSEWTCGEYVISTDRDRLNLATIHDYLSRKSYWAKGRTREQVERSIANSLNFGLFHGREQVGFARVVTDYATFGWIADVFILEAHRGKGLSKWVMEMILGHPALQGMRRLLLATRDAHGLYRRYGFNDLEDPSCWLEKLTEMKLTES